MLGEALPCLLGPGRSPQWLGDLVGQLIVLASLSALRQDPKLGRGIARALRPHWLGLFQSGQAEDLRALGRELQACLGGGEASEGIGHSAVCMLWSGRTRYVGKAVLQRQRCRGLPAGIVEHLRGAFRDGDGPLRHHFYREVRRHGLHRFFFMPLHLFPSESWALAGEDLLVEVLAPCGNAVAGCGGARVVRCRKYRRRPPPDRRPRSSRSLWGDPALVRRLFARAEVQQLSTLR